MASTFSDFYWNLKSKRIRQAHNSSLSTYPSETVRPWQLRKSVASSLSLKSSMRTTPSRGKAVERCVLTVYAMLRARSASLRIWKEKPPQRETHNKKNNCFWPQPTSTMMGSFCSWVPLEGRIAALTPSSETKDVSSQIYPLSKQSQKKRVGCQVSFIKEIMEQVIHQMGKKVNWSVHSAKGFRRTEPVGGTMEHRRKAQDTKLNILVEDKIVCSTLTST